MSYLILLLLSACITGMILAHRRAEALETDRALVLAQMRRPCPPSRLDLSAAEVALEGLEAEIDAIKVDKLLASLDEEA